MNASNSFFGNRQHGIYLIDKLVMAYRLNGCLVNQIAHIRVIFEMIHFFFMRHFYFFKVLAAGIMGLTLSNKQRPSFTLVGNINNFIYAS